MSAVFFWHYSLESAEGLNAVSQRTKHEGALIRVGDGFGCIHPWPELGDPPLAEQLLLLRDGGATPLISSALACAELDDEARNAGRSLFQGLSQPGNHRLVARGDDPELFYGQGFRSAKIKVGPDLRASLDTIRTWAKAGFRVRLDANDSVPFRSWLAWWFALEDSVQNAIEFVEDPCPFSATRWRILRAAGIPVAGDRDVEKRYRASSRAVYKPATDKGGELDTRLVNWALRHGRQVVVTSYMDHAIGQAWAAYAAGCLHSVVPEVVSDCGLLTHDRFAEDEFFARIAVEKTRFVPPGGTGLGFDDLLEKLPWKRLN